MGTYSDTPSLSLRLRWSLFFVILLAPLGVQMGWQGLFNMPGSQLWQVFFLLALVALWGYGFRNPRLNREQHAWASLRLGIGLMVICVAAVGGSMAPLSKSLSAKWVNGIFAFTFAVLSVWLISKDDLNGPKAARNSIEGWLMWFGSPFVGALIGYGWFCYFNAVLDFQSAQVHPVKIVEKIPRMSSSDVDRMVVSTWVPSENPVKLEVTPEFFAGIFIGETAFVSSKPGVFGAPWGWRILSYSVESTNQM